MTRLVIGAGLAAVVASFSCDREAPRGSVAPSTATAGTHIPSSIDARMHADLDSIREIHRALIFGDLDAARSRARQLSSISATDEVDEWERPVRFVREQALRLASATSARDARHLSTDLATVCADCHMVRARTMRVQAPPEPAADGSLRGAMARHEWAAETMWIGLIAPSSDIWRKGLAAITSPPTRSSVFPPRRRQREVERLRRRLVALAAESRDLPGQGDRARRLSEIVDVCAACHAIARR